MEFLPHLPSHSEVVSVLTAEGSAVKNKDVLNAVRIASILDARRRRVAGWLEAVCGGAHSAMEMEAALSMCE